MNKEQISLAARKLCQNRNEDPDQTVRMHEGCMYNPPVTRWFLAAIEVQKHTEVQEAIHAIYQQRGVYFD